MSTMSMNLSIFSLGPPSIFNSSKKTSYSIYTREFQRLCIVIFKLDEERDERTVDYDCSFSLSPITLQFQSLLTYGGILHHDPPLLQGSSFQ